MNSCFFYVKQDLIDSAQRGDMKEIQRCLDGGVNINYRNQVSYVHNNKYVIF